MDTSVCMCSVKYIAFYCMCVCLVPHSVLTFQYVNPYQFKVLNFGEYLYLYVLCFQCVCVCVPCTSQCLHSTCYITHLDCINALFDHNN